MGLSLSCDCVQMLLCSVCGQGMHEGEEVRNKVQTDDLVTRFLFLIAMCLCPLCEGDVSGFATGMRPQTPDSILKKYNNFLRGQS